MKPPTTKLDHYEPQAIPFDFKIPLRKFLEKFIQSQLFNSFSGYVVALSILWEAIWSLVGLRVIDGQTNSGNCNSSQTYCKTYFDYYWSCAHKLLNTFIADMVYWEHLDVARLRFCHASSDVDDWIPVKYGSLAVAQAQGVQVYQDQELDTCLR